MKSKYKVISFLLSLSLSLSGCGELSTNVDAENVVSTVTEEIDLEESASCHEVDLLVDEVHKDSDVYVEINERLKSKKTDSVILDELTQLYYDYFDSLSFEYFHEDMYPSYIPDTSSLGECVYTFDGNVTQLVNQIEENSNCFDDSLIGDYVIGETGEFFIDDSYREVLINAICNIVENSNNDIVEDMHLFSDLKIRLGVPVDDSTAIYDHDTNTIIINKDYITFEALVDGVSFTNQLQYVLLHELNHVRQNVCECRKNEVLHDIRYSPYEFFILESSAESAITNQNLYKNVAIKTYLEERNFEAELFLLALVSNKNLDEYYNAIFDTDNTSLMEFFSLNEDEIEDFYKILYNIDALALRNELPFNLVGLVGLENYRSTVDDIGYVYKINLFDLILKKLLIRNASEELSLEDNLVLYNFVKSILLFNDTAFPFPQYLIDSFTSIDQIFINYLSSKYDVSVDDIRYMEYVNVRILNVCINELITGSDVTNAAVIDKANSYIEKFPMLVPILSDTYTYSSNSFIKHNEDKYEDSLKR